LEQRHGDHGVTVVTAAIDIDAPADAVWTVISDPRNLPHWDRHIVRVNGVPSTGLEEGTRYTTDMRFVAVRATIRAEVLEWDPPHRATFRLEGLLDATITSTVDVIDATHSRLEHIVEYRFKGGPLGNVAARSLRLVGGAGYALRRGIAAQKREIESNARG
jgi:uncharacterized membrane protein